MKISEMIEKLQEIQKRHGDLPIVGGYLSDDRPPEYLTVINEDNVDINHTFSGLPAVGVFIE